ncbi:MAG: serine/threonine protein phosphatase PrpC [Psychromonas sp.]|jgi:serine/threonine protein phosphatase PrpC|uniref:protein kinase domain-containing protein n=1 Tax=Psychromonas sp. TaxID=1884585 RepID=UPI0039E4519D
MKTLDARVDGKKKSQVELCIGGYSAAGRREINQDAFAAKLPNSHSEKMYKGMVACIADGVSCSSNGQQASQTSVTQFINDYYGTPESWSVKVSASKVLNSLNNWLYQHSSKDEPRHNGFITTFSGIVFKSTTAHIFHVGDTRIYRYRNGSLDLMTKDHARNGSGKNSVLTRALGMDSHLEIDYQSMAVLVGDIFLLSSDGVHDYIPGKILSEYLSSIKTDTATISEFEKLTKSISSYASQKGSKDNLSCLIVQVKALPISDIGELFNKLTALTIPPAMRAGNEIDDFQIERVIHQGARSHLYLAREKSSQKQRVLKIPSLNFADDLVYLDGFAKEQWVGQIINNSHIMTIFPKSESSPFLYHICEYIDGITLRQWIYDNPHPSLEHTREIIKNIVAAVRVLQRAGMVHRDLKPENIMVSENRAITLIDFGTVKIDGLDEIFPAPTSDEPLGAADYIAPEYLNDGQACFLADLFSIAVISYELLCGELPYQSSNSSLRRARHNSWKYRSIQQFRADIPEWIDAALKKASHPVLAKRYGAMSEFITDLYTPNKNLIKERESFSLMERNPIKFWQSLSLVFLGIALFELLLLLGKLN